MRVPSSSTERLPGIIDELSGKEVMVMEFVQGTKITDIKTLKEKGIDLKELAFRLDITFLRMLLRDDIFHADPLDLIPFKGSLLSLNARLFSEK